MIFVFTVAIVLAGAVNAAAGWLGTGAGSGYSRALSIAAGNTPSVSVSGRNVTVSWSASAAPTDGYIVKRYNGSDQPQTVGSACAGTIAGLSCTENAVPPGSWRYTVTTAQANWRGAESAKSSTATVASPSFTLNSSSTNSLPATVTGNITGYISGQTVSFRLDDPSTGTLLTGSINPTPVQTNGTATTSVTVPAGTSNGAHTIYAIGNQGDQASAPFTVDRPVVSASVIAKSQGGVAGYIKQGGTYFVYANATGSGNPPAGLSTLRADVSAITTGATSVALTHGSFTAGGQSYNYRSAQQTANGSLAAGSKNYTLTLTDTASSQTQSTFSVTVDNTQPAASNIQTQNNNTTVGLAQITDTITYTFSEPMEPISILSGWNGTSTPVVVRLINGLILLGDDGVEIYNAADSSQLPLGQIDLGRGDYVGGLLGGEIARFGDTGTTSTMVMSGSTIVITLGTHSGQSLLTASGTGQMSWDPVTTPTDWAANAMSGAAVNESGGADKEFYSAGASSTCACSACATWPSCPSSASACRTSCGSFAPVRRG